MLFHIISPYRPGPSTASPLATSSRRRPNSASRAARPAAVMRYSFLRLSPAPSIGSIQPFSIRPDKAPYIVPADMRRRPRLIASTCCMMA